MTVDRFLGQGELIEKTFQKRPMRNADGTIYITTFLKQIKNASHGYQFSDTYENNKNLKYLQSILSEQIKRSKKGKIYGKF